MAKFVLTAANATIGGTDYSAQLDNVEIALEVETGDTTNYAGSGWKEFVKGLISYQVTFNFKKDADLSGLDAAIWTEISSGDCLMAWTAKTSTGAISTSNPEYQGNLIVTSWNPGPGQLGQVYGGSVTWQGTGSITRDTTP